MMTSFFTGQYIVVCLFVCFSSTTLCRKADTIRSDGLFVCLSVCLFVCLAYGFGKTAGPIFMIFGTKVDLGPGQVPISCV